MTENETEIKKEELINLLNKKLENLKELDEFGKDSNYIGELGEIALIQLQLEQFIDSEENYFLPCLCRTDGESFFCPRHNKLQLGKSQAGIFRLSHRMLIRRDLNSIHQNILNYKKDVI